jgi:hypothetical protein
MAMKTKLSHIFLVELVKKVLKTHLILIICSKVLNKKIDYVQCLLHDLLTYLIFWVIFSKKCFSKEFAILSPVYYWFHRNLTGWPCDSIRPVYHFPTGCSSASYNEKSLFRYHSFYLFLSFFAYSILSCDMLMTSNGHK